MKDHKKTEDERSTTKTDEDKDYGDKDDEHEICVISWNINRSSARYDFLRDVAQCQGDVAMFQETRKTGMKMVRLVNWMAPEGKTAIAVKKEYESSEAQTHLY